MSPHETMTNNREREVKTFIDAALLEKARAATAKEIELDTETAGHEPIKINDTGFSVVRDQTMLSFTLGTFEINGITFFIGAAS